MVWSLHAADPDFYTPGQKLHTKAKLNDGIRSQLLLSMKLRSKDQRRAIIRPLKGFTRLRF